MHNIPLLKSSDVKEHKLALFIQYKWLEYVHLQTIDSYRPRLMNIPRLLVEYKEVLVRSETEVLWLKHSKLIEEELSDLLTSLKCREFIADEDLWLIEKSLKEDDLNLKRAIINSLDLDTIENRYQTRVKRSFLGLVESDPEGKKLKHVEYLLDEVATIALNRGSLLESGMLDERLRNRDLGAEQCLKLIVDSVWSVEKKYSCVIHLNVLSESSIGELNGLLRRHGCNIVKSTKVGDSTNPNPSNSLYVEREYLASSHKDAIRNFCSQIDPVISSLAFYHRGPITDPVQEGWAKFKEEDDYTKISSIDGFYGITHKAKKSKELSKSLIDLSLEERVSRSVIASVDMYQAAMRGGDSRVRIVNLWSALECLSSSLKGKNSIISRVHDMVSPIIVWRRFEKKLRYIAISIHKWSKIKDEDEDFRLIFPKAEKYISVEDVLSVLSEPSGSDRIKGLLKFTSESPLLCNKVFELWKVFSNPLEMSKSIIRAEKVLKWNIWRIYRERNLRVHQGDGSERVDVLCENLNYYYMVCFSSVVEDLKFTSSHDVGDSIEKYRLKISYLKESLKDRPTSVKYSNLLCRYYSRFQDDPEAESLWKEDCVHNE